MISPQGYKLGEDPKNKNPFWGEGEDSSVDRIYATASVDDGTGVPSVTTSKTVSGSDITFGFDFHNLKGERGPQGPAGATGATGPAGPAGADGAPGATGATGPQGPEGPKGDTGATGPAGPAGEKGADGVSPTARVEQTGDNQVTLYVTDANGTTQAVLNGEAGPQGPEGPQGQAGPKGDTGERGPIGPEGPVGPKGDTGEQGPQGTQGPIGETGPKGDTGPAGPGVPAGGTAGQVLTKVDGTDYNTEWKDPSGGGGININVYRKEVNASWTKNDTYGCYVYEFNDPTLYQIIKGLYKKDTKIISIVITRKYATNIESKNYPMYNMSLSLLGVNRSYPAIFFITNETSPASMELQITVYYTD